MKLSDAALDLLIIAVVLLHLLVAPHTKVEESFNIQATHDVLVYGAPGFLDFGYLRGNITQKLSSFDHFAFPGAVPRTFIGPLFLAQLSLPFVSEFGYQHAQLIARGLLGLFNAWAIIYFRNQLRKACGQAASRWYAALQATQFHIMFYASRTLPNMFAFGLTTFAFGLLLPSNNPAQANNRIRRAIMLFVFAAVVFRSEVALLLGTNALWLLIVPAISLHRMIPPFAASFIVSVALSVLVDSYYWQKLLWPELWGFYYNVVQGSSSEWGTSPWYYYFVSALPKLLLNPLAIPLIGIGLYFPAYYRISQRLVVPNLLFVAIYSLQPHKEPRFIFYIVPPLTAAAALGAVSLTSDSAAASKKKDTDDTGRKPRKTFTALLIASILGSFSLSTLGLLASSLNYPGGEALAALNTIVRTDQGTMGTSLVTVHADVLSCMTGVTLFGVAGGDNVPTRHNFASDAKRVVAGTKRADDGDESSVPPAWLTLDKTEDDPALGDPNFWLRFDYLLMEDKAAVRGGKWDTIAVVEGLSGLEILRPGTELEPAGVPHVGWAARYGALRDSLRRLTGGWWVGPKLTPKIHIMKRVKGTAAEVERAAREPLAVA